MTEFNLAEFYARFLADAPEFIDNAPADLNDALEALIDSFIDNPKNVKDENLYDTALSLAASYAELSKTNQERLVDIFVTTIATDYDDRDQLERLSLLLHILMVKQIPLMTHKSGTASAVKAGKRSAVNLLDSTQSKLLLLELESICTLLRRIPEKFVTTSERDLFFGLFLKPINAFLELEGIVKSTSIRMHLFKALCISIKQHQQLSNVQPAMMQLLSYFEHMPEPLAELLQILHEQYDSVGLTDYLLKEVSTREYNSNDTKGPKVVASFLIKLATLIPRVVLRYLAPLSAILDSDSYTMRCAVIEVAGSIVIDIAKEDGQIELMKTQVETLLDLIEQRSLDISPYARARAIQMLTSISELEVKFNKHRPIWSKIAVRGIQDRASNVRKNAMKFMGRLINTHPFGLMHGSSLNLSIWEERFENNDKRLKELLPESILLDPSQSPTKKSSLLRDTVIEEDDEEMPDTADGVNTTDSEQLLETNKINTSSVEEEIQRLELTNEYYQAALEFIHSVHDALKHCEELLFSKTKSEIIDAMNLFVLGDAYQIAAASSGIRKMIHLVWAKANNDEGQAIQKHLVECYRQLFFEALVENPDLMVAKNMISLTYGATLAELASLEYLLVLTMEQERFSDEVIRVLWQIYGVQTRDISKSQRRGAIIILGMLAKADSSIASGGLDLLLKIGLGEQGRKDWALAKYSCICLQRCVDSEQTSRLPITHDIIIQLAYVVMMPDFSMEWFGVAEQAIKAIYDLCDEPDVVFSDLIREKTSETFEGNSESCLAQLLFVVGEVALKTLISLESYESQFKKAKNALDSMKKDDEDDLNQIGGTTEDDFTEAIMFVREKELLFGENSLLARFGQFVSDICKDGLTRTQSPEISIASTLCLSKLMCVSSSYCSQNLPILKALMETSASSAIRSNCVLCFGDIAVCFNHIIDDNTEFLYARLRDKYSVVQRTCLMTLTFLILAGQVKVKGQLGAMAKCLEADDEDISDLARMFFTELATKEGAIYNGFIDMFSVLSADKELSTESLQRILKFLIGFIDKEKQIKSVSDKLFARMQKTTDEKQWNNIAFVLNTLPHKQEEVTAFIEGGFKAEVAAA